MRPKLVADLKARCYGSLARQAGTTKFATCRSLLYTCEYQHRSRITVGVERAVTRWYVQRQTILNELAQLEDQLARASAPNVIEQAIQAENVPSSENNNPIIAELQQQVARTQAKLYALGPCPKPMMG